MATPPSSIMDHLDQTTVTSLVAVLMVLNSAYMLSRRALHPKTPTSLRILFIWHAFDFLIHTIFEGSFLWNCFFTSAPFDPAIHHPAHVTNFLSAPDRLYGAAYGDNWATKLWMVYAKADSRWAGADLTIISLELLTVLVAGPLAFYICTGIARRDERVVFWMIVLATGELYGGKCFPNLPSALTKMKKRVFYFFYLELAKRSCVETTGFMTFAPEWLTGNQNLDGSNFMFLWVYLVFFNMLWVFLPLYALWYSFRDISNAFLVRRGVLRMAAERAHAREGEEEKAKGL
jgi:hypothetical protein